MKSFNRLSFALLLGAAMASCSNDENAAVPGQQGVDAEAHAVQFSNYIPGAAHSRGASTTSDNIANFGVFGYKTGTAVWADRTNGQKVPDFMYNQLVEKSGSDWVYNPIKYWMNDAAEKISFFAYSPHTASPAAPAAGASGISAMSANDDHGNPTLDFVVGDQVSGHVDLVYAGAVNQTNANHPVNLEFNHALARVAFYAVGWETDNLDGTPFDANTTVTINDVTLATTRSKATLDLATGEWSSPVNIINAATQNRQGFVVGTAKSNIQNNVITAGTTDKVRLNLDNDYIMMLPDLGNAVDGFDQYVLFVDYTIKTIDPAVEEGFVEIRNNVYRYLTPKFEAGKSYAITVHLGMAGPSIPDDGDQDKPGETPVDPGDDDVTPTPASDAKYVHFSTTVTDWTADEEKNINTTGDYN